MRRRSFVPGLAVAQTLLWLGCGSSSPTGPDVLTVQAGTSFGMCPPTAYCQTTLQVTSGSAVFTKVSRELGEVRASAVLAGGEWERLVATVDEGRLRAQPDVIGCPDCADGGAEWVEVTAAGWTKRVTFQKETSPPAIQELVAAVRRIRQGIDAHAP